MLPARIDHDVRRLCEIVDGGDDFALRELAFGANAVDALDFFVPGCAEVGDLACDSILRRDNRRERRAIPASVTRASPVSGKSCVFVGVEFGDVDVDEANVGILKRGFRGAGEIGVTRADADDQVCVASEDVCAGSSGDADCADGLRVIVGKRAFARVGFADGNSRLRRRIRPSSFEASE